MNINPVENPQGELILFFFCKQVSKRNGIDYACDDDFSRMKMKMKNYFIRKLNGEMIEKNKERKKKKEKEDQFL